MHQSILEGRSSLHLIQLIQPHIMLSLSPELPSIAPKQFEQSQDLRFDY
jgi:hypothetical protein